MKHIILDTNAVMAVGELGIDIFTEIDNAMNSLYDVNVLSGTIKELEKVVAEQRGKFRDAAQLSLMLLKQKNVSIIPSTGHVDDVLADYSSQGYLILTQDQELKKRLTPPYLTIRQKKTVMVVQ